MARIILNRLKGSTLVEVLAATVILMVILGISTMIFYRVTSSSYTSQQKKADLLLTELSFTIKKDQKLFNEQIETDAFIIMKEVEKYKGSEDVFAIVLKAFDKEEKLIAERKELILLDVY